MLSFLDALENGLHPQGCLEPPLWFLRQQQINTIPRSTSISSTIKYVQLQERNRMIIEQLNLMRELFRN